MSSKKGFFQQMDETLFTQIDRFISADHYQKYQELISGLDEKWQKIVNQSLSIFLSFVPVFLVLIIFATNCSQKSEISEKKEIISSIDQYILKKDEVDGIGRQIVSSKAVETKQDIEGRLKLHLDRDGISSSKIKINEVLSSSSSDTLKQTQADIEFQEFTTTDLTNFLTALLQKEKFKVSRLEIRKDPKLNLLRGSLTTVSFSRAGK